LPRRVAQQQLRGRALRPRKAENKALHDPDKQKGHRRKTAPLQNQHLQMMILPSRFGDLSTVDQKESSYSINTDASWKLTQPFIRT
jgi:hypothetical protein